jgi:HAD superfamily hydrolase (TIGR01450 family)
MPAGPNRPPRLVIFDLDGVVYRGREPVPGAVALIAWLRARGILVRYATNNSMASREAYVHRLGDLGITAAADEVVTSTSATIGYLRHHLPDVHRVLSAGSPGMTDQLRLAGFAVTAAADAVPEDYDGGPLGAAYDAVVAGLDQETDYRRIAAAASAIRAGAVFVATNADLRFPTPRGFLPGAGSIVAAIRAAAGDVEPTVIGKPGPAMFNEILETARVDAGEAIVVGDNPDADIVAASRTGVFSVLVLTGVATADLAAELTGERHPDLVVPGPSELQGLLGEWLS